MTNHIAAKVTIAIALCGSPQMRAQSQASSSPAFDFVSVKPNKSATAAGDRGIHIKAGRFTATRVDLIALIAKAYDVPSLLIYGGPSWVNSEAFDVEARTNASADEDQVKRMLQTLLAVRFQLRVLHQMKDVPTSSMTIGERSSKLTTPKPGETSSLTWSQVSITGQRVTMSDLASFLTRGLRQIVIDKTGIEDEFDFKIDNVPGAAPWTQLSVLAMVLQEQLDLRLEPHKGPVQTLVIDLVGKPSEN
jgi:uncharacterized protein (TIGR03435 family)